MRANVGPEVRGVSDTIATLRQRCVVTWQLGCLEAIAAVGAGMSERDAADVLGLSERALRRRLEQARSVLSEATGLEANTAMLVTWFSLHVDCCCAGILKKLAGTAR